MPPAPLVAVVGAGLAGAACARALVAGGAAVQVHDRGRAPGGRMASPHLAGRPVDLGASYLTVRDVGFRAVVDDWLGRGLAHPWTDAFHVATPDGLGARTSGPLRYGAPGGLRALVADLLDGLDVRQGSTVTRIGPGPVVDGTAYDAVVLAMPDPQALRLLDDALVEERAAVHGRQWEPVLAVAAGWPERTWDERFDGCFVGDSAVLGWVADDGRRRRDGAPVLVAHSTSPFAAARLDDADPGPLVDEVRRVLGIDAPPLWTRGQRWSYARPAQTRDVDHFLGAARVGLCGDGWGSPRVETAWTSGTALGRALLSGL